MDKNITELIPLDSVILALNIGTDESRNPTETQESQEGYKIMQRIRINKVIVPQDDTIDTPGVIIRTKTALQDSTKTVQTEQQVRHTGTEEGS